MKKKTHPQNRLAVFFCLKEEQYTHRDSRMVFPLQEGMRLGPAAAARMDATLVWQWWPPFFFRHMCLPKAIPALPCTTHHAKSVTIRLANLSSTTGC